MLTGDLLALALSGDLAQQAESTHGIPTGEYAIEPKLDGWRLLAHRDETGVTFYTRAGNAVTGDTLPKVRDALMAHFPAGTWLDGEGVAIRHLTGGKVVNEWKTAQSVLSKAGSHAAADRITFMVFDLIAHRGIDARALPYASRRELLSKAFASITVSQLQLVPSVPAAAEVHEAFVGMGFEGTMLKKLSAAYSSGKRGYGWMKWKAETSEDVICIGGKPGKSGLTGLVGAVVFGQIKDGQIIERGHASGMDMITRRDMTAHDAAGNVILAPHWQGRVIEVTHNGTFPTGSFRNPRMIRIRDDKAATQCLWSLGSSLA